MLRLSVLIVALFAFVIELPCHPVYAQQADFVRGDVDGDGAFNFADPITILFYFEGGLSLSCLDSADANDDDAINIVDPIYLLAALFVAGSNAPMPPFPACGPDPTAGTLDCIFYPLCP